MTHKLFCETMKNWKKLSNLRQNWFGVCFVWNFILNYLNYRFVYICVCNRAINLFETMVCIMWNIFIFYYLWINTLYLVYI